MEKMKILSLGGGVQSSAMMLMSQCGMLPKYDHIIFADTQYEPRHVYETLDFLEKETGRKILKPSKGNIKEDLLQVERRAASIPFYLGDSGMAMRQCSKEYKIEVIEKCVRREIVGLKNGQSFPKDLIVEFHFGMTFDEVQRCKISQKKYFDFVYPLCNIPGIYLERRWVRQDCIDWLKTNYPEHEFKKSACLCCPYKDNQHWFMTRENKQEWQDVCDFDDKIRVGRMKKTQFLHRSRRPLRDVPLTVEEDDRNGVFWNQECDGICGT
jgi:hypothetical protein